MDRKPVVDKELKTQVALAGMQFIVVRKNMLSLRQIACLSRVRGNAGPTAGGDVYLEGVTRGRLQAGDLVGATHVTEQRINDQLGLFPEFEEMYLLSLQGDLLWEARKFWAENRKSRPANFYILMMKKNKMGRPPLKEKDRRVKMSVSVAPKGAALLDSMRGKESRGAILDCLLKYKPLARAIAGIAKTKKEHE